MEQESNLHVFYHTRFRGGTFDHLGESIHLEIERDMAFLFRKMMNLGRHGLKELLLVAGYCLAQVLRDRFFVTSSWQIFRSSGLPSSLGFSIASKERNANKENPEKHQENHPTETMVYIFQHSIEGHPPTFQHIPLYFGHALRRRI